MKIYAPNKEYTGVSASVPFVNGVGETDDPHLIQWFKRNGYQVGDENQEVTEDVPTLEKMRVTDLRDMAREKGIKGYAEMSKDELVKALK